MKKNILFSSIFLSLYFWAGYAFAQATGGGNDATIQSLADKAGVILSDEAIYQSLAYKAGLIGQGLRDVGYVIAGLGLIVFSFMAIFNKISWKTLAYIMLSTFILSVMVATINYASNEKAKISFGDSRAGQLDFGDSLGKSASPANETPPAMSKTQ